MKRFLRRDVILRYFSDKKKKKNTADDDAMCFARERTRSRPYFRTRSWMKAKHACSAVCMGPTRLYWRAPDRCLLMKIRPVRLTERRYPIAPRRRSAAIDVAIVTKSAQSAIKQGAQLLMVVAYNAINRIDSAANRDGSSCYDGISPIPLIHPVETRFYYAPRIPFDVLYIRRFLW